MPLARRVQFTLGMPPRTLEGSAGPDEVRRHMRSMPKRFRTSAVDGLVAEWELRLGPDRFVISVGDHRCEVHEGPGMGPDTVIVTEPATWIDIDEGRTTGGQAFLDHRLIA